MNDIISIVNSVLNSNSSSVVEDSFEKDDIYSFYEKYCQDKSVRESIYKWLNRDDLIKLVSDLDDSFYNTDLVSQFFSYFNMVSSDPPCVMFSTRRDNNTNKDTLNNVLNNNQFVVNLVTKEVVEQMNTTSANVTSDIDEFEFAPILNSVVSMQQGHAQKKNLGLIFVNESSSPLIVADGRRLRQVLLNLISNALKFTETGRVTVRAKDEASGDGKKWIRIEVEDTGIGIAEEAQHRIFEKFNQAESFSKRSYQGSGLGLTLAKELVERMGGTIGLQSTIGVGSLFWVVLPAGGQGENG